MRPWHPLHDQLHDKTFPWSQRPAAGNDHIRRLAGEQFDGHVDSAEETYPEEVGERVALKVNCREKRVCQRSQLRVRADNHRVESPEPEDSVGIEVSVHDLETERISQFPHRSGIEVKPVPGEVIGSPVVPAKELCVQRADIRRLEPEDSARSQDAAHFLGKPARIGDVLDDVAGGHQIEVLLRKVYILETPGVSLVSGLRRQGYRIPVEIHPVRLDIDALRFAKEVERMPVTATD